MTGTKVTITDDDATTSVVRIANASAVTEGNAGATTDMTFTLSIAPVSGRAVTVPYTLSGTATGGGDDYVTPDPLEVVIPKGASSVDLTITIKGDVKDEPNETVIVTLGNPTNAARHATQNAGTGSINDDDAAVAGVTLSVSPATVGENDAAATAITVTATVTGTTRFGDQETLTVAVGADADTAEEGVDYGNVGALTITIAAGADSGTVEFSLDPTDDELDEDDETLSVTGTVTTETGVTVTGTTVTITDDDATTSVVSIANASAVTEGNAGATTDMTFTLSMAPVSGRAVTVPYTLSGTATGGGDDYVTPDPLEVVIPKGATSVDLTITIKGDVKDEPNETVIVTLSNPTNATRHATQNAGTGTINDDDAAVAGVTLSVSPASVDEDDADATSITVTATVTGATRYGAEKTVTVAVGDDGDSATEGTDYTEVGAVTITLAEGADSAQASFSLDPTDDELDEDDEEISVTGAVTGEATTVTGTKVTITDDDATTSVVSIANASAVTEGNAGATTDMTFTLSMAPVSGRAVTVPFSLSGTATGGGDDYVTPDPLEVVIAKGASSVDLTIVIKGDVKDEPNETVIVTLGNPTNAGRHATQNAGTGTINDDDAAVAGVTLSVSPASVGEGDENATEITVTATVTGASRYAAEKTVTVTVGKATDTATEATDYETVGALTIALPVGDTSAAVTFDLTPTDDSVDEDDEKISVDGAVGSESTTVTGTEITITDDDSATSKVSVANADAVTEGDVPGTTTDMTFAVSMAPASGRLVTVPYTLSGTATAGDDYTGTASGSVTLAAGATSATITVPVKGDVLDEINETVIVTLGAPTHAAISSAQNAGTAEGIITDDDAAVAGVTLSVSPASVGEEDSATAITVTATVTGASRYAAGKTVTVAVGAAGDSATEGTDYTEVGAVTITLAEGADSAQASFSLDPLDDELDEDDEEISVTGAVTGEATTVTGTKVTITDDDATTSVVSIANASAVTEGNAGATTDMTFTLSMAPVSGRAVTVPFSFSGTATGGGDDYVTPAPLEVVIPKGASSVDLTITIKGDVKDEPNETVIVTLGNPTNASRHATQNAGTGTINDDDAAVAGVTLSVSPASVDEDDADATSITVTATVTGATRYGAEKTVTVTVGDDGDSATEGTDYTEVEDLTITLAEGATRPRRAFRWTRPTTVSTRTTRRSR